VTNSLKRPVSVNCYREDFFTLNANTEPHPLRANKHVKALKTTRQWTNEQTKWRTQLEIERNKESDSNTSNNTERTTECRTVSNAAQSTAAAATTWQRQLVTGSLNLLATVSSSGSYSSMHHIPAKPDTRLSAAQTDRQTDRDAPGNNTPLQCRPRWRI